jgi:dihydroneopterin aldolase
MEDSDSNGAGKANFNCAFGAQALQSNLNGDSNNAVGASALQANLTGLFNQAVGAFALSGNGDGAANVAIGDSAMAGSSSGSFNTVVGDLAGPDITDGTDNIYIGAGAGTGAGNESQTIRIGEPGFIAACFVQGISGVIVTGSPVVVDANGQLGVAAAGSPLSLKEVVKERQVVQQLKATTEKQAARIALQENQIQTLTAALKQQAQQIQKVSAQLEMIRPMPRVVENR